MAYSLSGTTITQTGTDNTLNGLNGIGNASVIIGTDGITIADISSYTLNIQGTLTIDYKSKLIGNNTIINIQTGGSLILDGTNTINGVEFSYAPTLLNINSSSGGSPNGIIRLIGTTPLNPALFLVKNATVRTIVPGGQWSAISCNVSNGDGANIFRTQGKIARFFSHPTLSGTSKDRMRFNSRNKVVDFQAEETFTDLWLNLSANQFSLAGYTPINVDGPEINAFAVSVANRVDFKNYNSDAVIGAYYTNSEIVNWGDHYTRFINSKSLLQNRIRNSGPGNGITEFSKEVKISIQDLTGTLINDVIAAHKYPRAYPSGYNAKGGVTPSNTHVQNEVVFVESSGSADFEVIVAATSSTTTTWSLNKTFIDNPTPGAETHNFTVGSYGYNKVIDSVVPMNGINAAEILLKLSPVPTTLTKSQASVLTGISVNHTTKLITITEQRTPSQIFDYLQNNLYDEANIFIPNIFTFTNEIIGLGDYSLVFNGNYIFTGNIITTGTVTGDIFNGGNVTVIGTINDSNGIRATKTLTLTGLQNPSKINLFNKLLSPTDNNYELDSQIITAGTYNYIFNVADNINAIVRIISTNENFLEFDVELNQDINIPISQQIDRIYENN